MGQISINTSGSFPQGDLVISALPHGHAHAVEQAIRYFLDLLPWAISHDHNLHEDGEYPEKGFSVRKPV